MSIVVSQFCMFKETARVDDIPDQPLDSPLKPTRQDAQARDPINNSGGTSLHCAPHDTKLLPMGFPSMNGHFSHLRGHLPLKPHLIRHVVGNLPFLARSTQVQQSPETCADHPYASKSKDVLVERSLASHKALLQHLVIRGNEWTV